MKGRPSRVVVDAAAKVNLGWRVRARREDGYHEVDGLLQTITLHDTLEIRTGEGDGFHLEVPEAPDLEGDDNLIRAAARVLAERTAPPATTIVLHKRIPVAAGLGGGSADAAAAIAGLDVAWGCRLAPRELLRIAADVGSDVAPILLGGLVHASGHGEVVRSIGTFTDGWLVLGVGAEHVSAADAYARFDEIGSTAPATFHHNDLEGAACALVSGLRERVETMREACGVAFVSGSGPTVVGVATDEGHADRARAAVADRFAAVHLAQPSPWGVRLRLGP